MKATLEGVGVHLALAVEYRISKSLGIALDCYEIISLVDDERISAGNEVAGIKRMGFAGGLRAVSYTHLDVYKRQGVGFHRPLQIDQVALPECAEVALDEVLQN